MQKNSQTLIYRETNCARFCVIPAKPKLLPEGKCNYKCIIFLIKRPRGKVYFACARWNLCFHKYVLNYPAKANALRLYRDFKSLRKHLLSGIYICQFDRILILESVTHIDRSDFYIPRASPVFLVVK